MDLSWGPDTLAELAARCPPVDDAGIVAKEVAEEHGRGPSSNLGDTWGDWLDELNNRYDVGHISIPRQAGIDQASWPPTSAAAAGVYHAHWLSRYERAAGCGHTAQVMVAGGWGDATQRPYVLEYYSTLALLLVEFAAWVGWLNALRRRWHRTGLP